MTLKNGQFQIGSVVFGEGTIYQVSNVEVSGYDVQAGQYAVPMTDEIRFGRDFLSPSTITFTMAALNNFYLQDILPIAGVDPALLPPLTSGREATENLAAEWRADDIRSKWGYLKPLYYARDGKQLRIYGRPRKFASGSTGRKAEWIDMVCDYQRVDTISYSDTEYGVVVDPSAAGTTPGSVVRADGSLPTWVRILITGPITNPKVKFGNLFTIELTTVLAAGKVIEINSYPWERRIINSDAANLSASLTGASPYLDEVKLPPKATTGVGLSGTGTTGATNAAILWREAYATF